MIFKVITYYYIDLHNTIDIIDPHTPTTIELTMTLEP